MLTEFKEDLKDEDLKDEDIEEDDLIEEEIDTSWIDDFKKDNETCSDFYTEEVTTITLFFIYRQATNVIIGKRQML